MRSSSSCDAAARAAWRRRVARIGALIQLLFAALWLTRGSLATGWPGRLPIAITLAAAAVALGSGKATLPNCLSGLDTMDGGRVWIEEPICPRCPTRRGPRTGGAWGSFPGVQLFPVFTAAENVELPLLSGPGVNLGTGH